MYLERSPKARKGGLKSRKLGVRTDTIETTALVGQNTVKSHRGLRKLGVTQTPSVIPPANAGVKNPDRVR